MRSWIGFQWSGRVYSSTVFRNQSPYARPCEVSSTPEWRRICISYRGMEQTPYLNYVANVHSSTAAEIDTLNLGEVVLVDTPAIRQQHAIMVPEVRVNNSEQLC